MLLNNVTKLPSDSVEKIASSKYGDDIAMKDFGTHVRYYMGEFDDDIFLNVFNVKLKDGVRDDNLAVAYFTEKYGFGT